MGYGEQKADTMIKNLKQFEEEEGRSSSRVDCNKRDRKKLELVEGLETTNKRH